METKKLLGKRIKELIKRKGYSQEKLAEMIDIEPTALSNIVTGRNYPLLGTLDKLVNVLGVSYNDIFDFEHQDTNENLKNKILEILENYPDKITDIYKIAVALTK